MHRDESSDAVCRCGHGRAAHEHYRAGAECAVCSDCPKFRPSGGIARRLSAIFRRRPRAGR